MHSHGHARCGSYMRHNEILGLKVKLPILANTDNGGAVDLGYNWGMGGRTCHKHETEFCAGMKRGMYHRVWLGSMVNNESDMFSKNLVGPEFNKHVAKLCGHNKYYNSMQDMESHEQWRMLVIVEHSWLEKSNGSRSKSLVNYEKCAENWVGGRMNLWD